jgi:signal transduction histidine kinase/CheY-like chemotaxis protein
MQHTSALYSFLQNRRLALRLVAAIIGCSLLCIVLGGGIQIWLEYRQSLRDIEARFDFIRQSYVPALTASAYQLDEEQLRLQLRGLLQLQDIVHVVVREQLNNEIRDVAEGDDRAANLIVREYPLVYQAVQPVAVGQLEVRASLHGVYARLKQQALTILLSNVMLVVPLAVIILVLFQRCLNRHLIRVVNYTASLDLQRLDEPLALKRPPSAAETPDELDQLVLAINEMRLRISEGIRHRQDAEHELQLRKALLECVLEARIDGICITGTDKTCLFGNQQFSSLWQAVIDCMPGQPTMPIFAHIGQQVANTPAFEEVRLRSEQETDAVFQGELELANGATFEYYTVPVRSGEGLLYGRLWSFRDVSQRKNMEEQLRQARKMETLGSLAGGIAHDFNNLLSPIIGYSELGLSRLPPGDPLAISMAQILKAASRAADLTRQILAFSRKQMLEVRIIDLNEVIGEYEDMLRRLLGETITINIMLSPQASPVRADRSQIEQVLLNMAINARDAMLEGGSLTIETAEVYLDQRYAERHVEVESGDYVMLSISDTGVGIEEAIRDRIFEPFFTTKERGKGTGLGLATSFGIIKQHHGHLWVYSEPGHGTTFKIYLPKAEEGAGVAVDRSLETHLAPASGEHVLVVEDDEMVRELVCETLIAHGFQVSEADQPEVALGLIGRIAPVDLLLTDVIMPQMNGRELHRQLASRIPGLKVLYMSGYTENVIADQGMLYAGVDFLQKPFSVRTLLEKVQLVMGRPVERGVQDGD